MLDALWWQAAGAAGLLIALAEIGDKSQLVCMALAARHKRARPVLLGALAAFGILNVLAVLFGGALAAWLPPSWVLAGMAILFAGFGIHALQQRDDDEDEDTGARKALAGRGLFLTAFAMIFLAEMGDKTQITVVGLAGMYPPTAVWVGATAAEVLVAAIGVLAGKALLARLPIHWLHRMAGVLFLGLAALAVWKLLTL